MDGGNCFVHILYNFKEPIDILLHIPCTIARNMAVDLMRKTKREILTEDFADTMTETASDACVETKVLSDISLRQALDTLKPNEQEVVNLKIMGELTFQEIADILKIPLGTVTWRYQNAIKKLRRCGYE